MLQTIQDRLMLRGIRQQFREFKKAYRQVREAGRLASVFEGADRAGTKPVRLEEFVGRLTDGPNGYIQYKDLFLRQIYRFNPMRPDPFIIDSGSNIGMSIVYFKRMYPQARIIGFEPDAAVFRILEENVRLNQLTNVQLIQAALGQETGSASFRPDGESGGQLDGNGKIQVRVERLSDYLQEPVDFLKLNIEGAELDVLAEVTASGRLANVREMVIEYHGWPQGEQRLGSILNLLDQQRFRYLVHDFDEETCGTSKPPFRCRSDMPWFCLIYAAQATATSAAA